MTVPERQFDVLCYGTISMDTFTRVATLPTPKREAQAIAEYHSLGGEALGVAIPLASWGMRVLVAGNYIGTDWKGQFIMDELARHPNIDTRYVRQHENVNTPYSRILITLDGEHSPIAYWYDRTPKVELTRAMMAQAGILSVDAYGGDERDRAAQVARDLGRTVIAANAIWPQYPLASLSHVVIVSRSWLQAHFPGVYEYDHALELQVQGAGLVLITDGDQPVLVVRPDGTVCGVEAFPVEPVIDTSSAGELFKAGLIYAWQTDWPLEKKIRFACAAAALSVQREAAVSQPPSLAEIEELLAAHGD